MPARTFRIRHDGQNRFCNVETSLDTLILCKTGNLSWMLTHLELLRRFDWSEEELRVLEVFCEARNYLEEVEIYSGAQGVKPHWSYFVVTGECELAREISYSVTESGTILKHLKSAENNANQNVKVIKNLLNSRRVSKGFTLEELLSKMASDLENSLPSDQTLLERFIDYEEATQAVASTLKRYVERQTIKVNQQ
ncbi:cyclic nucleotide-binding domain-containing protein [Caerostris extrusa]|uniref:Cyclic nucleotide-binding domain-containing protein n=1 Tax=Caerostris extrusa TaxID=172846 RepID=A0AAV4PSC4_CAEEX|nr:cyclic nucleotide-binding domain-containing protein [Caerostris extrusa]